MPGLKKKFLSYHSFAAAKFSYIFNSRYLTEAWTSSANNFSSCYLENLGHGAFRLHPMPVMAQLAPLYGMVVDDFDGYGNLDVACNGNDYGTEVLTGRYDAKSKPHMAVVKVFIGNGSPTR